DSENRPRDDPQRQPRHLLREVEWLSGVGPRAPSIQREPRGRCDRLEMPGNATALESGLDDLPASRPDGSVAGDQTVSEQETQLPVGAGAFGVVRRSIH